MEDAFECILTGRDGNAVAVMARVSEALRRKKVEREVIARYRAEALASDYDKLLSVSIRTLEDNGISWS